MRAVVSSIARRRPATPVVALAALAITALACAGHQHLGDVPPHPIAVQVDNNLAEPVELTVFIAQDQGGMRSQMGTVPGAQSKTFTFTPPSWGQTYRFIAERALGGPMRSPAFTIADPLTGSIVWTVVPNDVQFYQTEEGVGKPATTASH